MSLQLLVLLFLSALLRGRVKAQTPLLISRSLLNAIRQIESGGDLCAIGDSGNSIGPYQIMDSYYTDALQFNPSLADGVRTYRNVWGIGSESYSEDVISSYMGRYATPQRLGRQPTDEDIARIHNGGPNGYKSDSTLQYWTKVMNELQRQQRNGRQTNTTNQCTLACLEGQCCSNTGTCDCLSASLTVQPCMTQSRNSSALGTLSTLKSATIALLVPLILYQY